jgi:protein involved in polysaccharide export with SLBB domain
VLFPNAVAYEKKLTLNDYVQKAGGFTQNADSARIVIAHRDGSFTQNESDGWFSKNFSSVKISSGDELLVLPKIDVKSRQIFKELVAVIYQIAVTSKIVMGF